MNNQLENTNFDTISKIYKKWFSLCFMGNDLSDKLACLGLICYVTNTVRQKGKKVTCYEIILNIGKDYPDIIKNSIFKVLGAVCEDLMYGCTMFPDFGIAPKNMLEQIKKLLDKYVPF